MAILKKLFNSGAKDLIDSVGNAIDKIHTSAEEKELIKNEINTERTTSKKAKLRGLIDLDSQLPCMSASQRFVTSF